MMHAKTDDVTEEKKVPGTEHPEQEGCDCEDGEECECGGCDCRDGDGACQQDVDRLEKALKQAQENELRAMADYHNVVRRTQEQQAKMIKFAARDVIEGLLQPLEHLFLAKEQLKDKGLDMVYQQFQTALQSEGLQEIECLGKEFNADFMEVVDKQKVDDKKDVEKVIKVMQRGYTLNGEVIRHARVVIGTRE